MRTVELITTTSSVEGWKIKKYLGVVTYQIVTGANMFKDMFAGFRDIFGGESSSYQKELARMENIAIEILSRKTIRMGGNGILGLRLDFDEISGGGKSMFMLSASGTAIFAEREKTDGKIEYTNEMVSADKIANEIKIDSIMKEYEEGTLIIKGLDTIEEFTRLNCYLPEIVSKYFVNLEQGRVEEQKEVISEYFKRIPHEKLSSFLMSEYFTELKFIDFTRIFDVITATDWFDYEVLGELIKNENPEIRLKGFYLALIIKNIFNKEDIEHLLKLSEVITKACEVYPIQSTKKGLIGKEKTGWYCMQCGEFNELTVTKCSHYPCNANMYGIPNNEWEPNMLAHKIFERAEKLKRILEERAGYRK